MSNETNEVKQYTYEALKGFTFTVALSEKILAKLQTIRSEAEDENREIDPKFVLSTKDFSKLVEAFLPALKGKFTLSTERDAFSAKLITALKGAEMQAALKAAYSRVTAATAAVFDRDWSVKLTSSDDISIERNAADKIVAVWLKADPTSAADAAAQLAELESAKLSFHKISVDRDVILRPEAKSHKAWKLILKDGQFVFDESEAATAPKAPKAVGVPGTGAKGMKYQVKFDPTLATEKLPEGLTASEVTDSSGQLEARRKVYAFASLNGINDLPGNDTEKGVNNYTINTTQLTNWAKKVEKYGFQLIAK